MLNSHSIDVLIAGAGPTGLMAALLLQRGGLKIRIIDKNTQQAHESRAFAVHARSLELMQTIGLAEKFLQEGVIAPGVQAYVNGHKAAELNVTDIHATTSPYSFVLMLPQSQIEEILLTELESRGVKVEHNTQLTHFTQDNNGVKALVTNQHGQTETITANYLIGADGAHSTVRNVLGLTFAGAAYPQSFMLADCDIDWPIDHAFVKIFMRKTAFAIFMPLKGIRGRVITMTPKISNAPESAAAKEATTAEPVTLTEVEKTFQDAVGLPVTLSNPIWATAYRIHHRGTNKYREGRVFVAGDAAHIHSPVGGQGMNTGIQDAANLAWKLNVACKTKNNKLLDTYNSERWPIGQKLLHYTDNLFSQVSSQTRFTAMLRNTFMPLVIKLISKSSYCRANAFRFLSQLGIRYHDNEFLVDDIVQPAYHISKKLSAGHRAPNAYFKQNHDLFNLIKGYEFNVLALSKQALSKTEIEEIAANLATLPKDIGLPLHTHFICNSLIGENEKIIQAETNQLFETYGLTDKNPFGLFLIRPDGYIAYRSNAIDIDKLKKFCHLFNN